MDSNTNTNTNTTLDLYRAVQDIAEMVSAYFKTCDAPVKGQYQKIGVAGFTVGSAEIRVATEVKRSLLWVTTFEKGLVVEHTRFAWPTDRTSPATIEAVAVAVAEWFNARKVK